MNEEELVHPHCPASSRNVDIEECKPTISPAISVELEHSSDTEEVQESAFNDIVEPLPLGCKENPKAIQSLRASSSSSLPPTLSALLQSITSAALVTTSSTQISYSIPGEIANLESLIVADFSRNNFTDRIPDSVQLLYGLVSNSSPQFLTKSTTTEDPMYIPPLQLVRGKLLIRGEFDDFSDDKQMHCTVCLAEMLNAYAAALPNNIPTKEAAFLLEV
ncbi:uncharacterized protein LOC114581300 [Dendrobium catenatum]|nr:uncharacterized protein LOC114581300 [Dendrobium catenatum]